MAFHVSTHNVSIVDLICCFERVAQYNVIMNVMKQVSKVPRKGLLGYTEDQIMSCEFNSDSYFLPVLVELALFSMTTL
ncbi:rCG48651 [Rattus norvegicus]|uniref:glyceraldehyde-3-phosphate dehydrogenase (phosphorylating) n=1 Tax=Rattus norvegicus TaxID=10116 RepID=A6IGA7_RAT|nr:rCG48651 [Rattus norvegicus]